MEEEYVNKKELERRGFRRGDDCVYRKLSVLEQLAQNGWLDYGDARFSADDRKSIGLCFAKDYNYSRIDHSGALNLAKIRVDGSGNQITPEDVALAEDRYRKALKAIPEGCRHILRQVCIEDKDFKILPKMTRYQQSKERIRQATLLCLGLDELGKFYLGLRNEKHKVN